MREQLGKVATRSEGEKLLGKPEDLDMGCGSNFDMFLCELGYFGRISLHFGVFILLVFL